MSDLETPIVILGASSRLGDALFSELVDRRVLRVSRRRGRVDDVVVDNYEDLPSCAIPRGACVINCIGSTQGSEGDLHRINCDLSLSLAKTAAADASHWIQISSFSVYGAEPHIDRNTPTRASTAYGRSKLRADEALMDLASGEFRVTILRVPMLYGDNKDDKLARLIAGLRRFPVIPVTPDHAQRSMLSYRDCAAVIRQLIDRPRHGLVLAADPTPFSLPLLQSAFADAERRLYFVHAPEPIMKVARRAAPSLYSRLYSSSRLSAADNFANSVVLPQGIGRAILSMIKTGKAA